MQILRGGDKCVSCAYFCLNYVHLLCPNVCPNVDLGALWCHREHAKLFLYLRAREPGVSQPNQSSHTNPKSQRVKVGCRAKSSDCGSDRLV